jgi:hypothetical protein
MVSRIRVTLAQTMPDFPSFARVQSVSGRSSERLRKPCIVRILSIKEMFAAPKLVNTLSRPVFHLRPLRSQRFRRKSRHRRD